MQEITQEHVEQVRIIINGKFLEQRRVHGEDLEGAALEALVHLARSFDASKGNGNFFAYIHTMLPRRIIDHIRSETGYRSGRANRKAQFLAQVVHADAHSGSATNGWDHHPGVPTMASAEDEVLGWETVQERQAALLAEEKARRARPKMSPEERRARDAARKRARYEADAEFRERKRAYTHERYWTDPLYVQAQERNRERRRAVWAS